MTAYYNEFDPYAAQWLRNLIAAGHIADGVVDERSIEDVRPSDLKGFTQCHFFAGIGVWSYALRNAGWPDDRPVWTGSCPCQPFSAAGAGAGFADERHLWPAFFHFIQECKPAVVFGEQVASKDANPWIDLVQTDLEAVGYGVGAIAFPAASVGAPHIRDRLYWVADSGGARGEVRVSAPTRGHQGFAGVANNSSSECSCMQRGCAHCGYAGVGGVGHAGYDHDAGQEPTSGAGQPQADRPADQPGGSGVSPSGLADARSERRQQDSRGTSCDEKANGAAGWNEQQPDCNNVATGNVEIHRAAATGPTNGFWRNADWLLCRDGRWRPVEPGTFPLVNGASSRVGRLRAYGKPSALRKRKSLSKQS